MRNTGHPPKFESAEELERQIQEYFDQCDEGYEREIVTKKGDVIKIRTKLPYTVAGLAYHLGFASRQSLWDYQNRNKREDLAYIVSRAKLKIDNQLAVRGLIGDIEPRVATLMMSSNFGYSPRQEHIHREGPRATEDDLIEGSIREQIAGPQKQLPAPVDVDHETG